MTPPSGVYQGQGSVITQLVGQRERVVRAHVLVEAHAHAFGRDGAALAHRRSRLITSGPAGAAWPCAFDLAGAGAGRPTDAVPVSTGVPSAFSAQMRV
jgi:hypothetical protein